jgi:Domain of unknown function (DUF5664)/Domain of unknown function (DUF4406)
VTGRDARWLDISAPVVKASGAKVYISGPMTGYEDRNFPAFRDEHRRLASHGYEVLDPSENFGGVTDLPRSRYMREDIAHVLEAQWVSVLPGWSGSKGARLEVALALELGIPVIDQMTGASIAVEHVPAEALPEEPKRTDGEVRVVDPVTGGAKGAKLAELGALDPRALLAVAEVAGFGSRKYERGNYLKGYRWSLSFDAMQHHLLEFWAGDDTDDESGLPHVAHAAWHALALLAFVQRGIGTDDRP